MTQANDTNYLMNSDLRWNGWRQAQKTITFAGATGNAIGDFAGTQNPFTIFTVTGDVIVKVVGICTTNLASTGAGTLEVGVVGGTATLLAQTTATAIDAGEIWHDSSPDAFVELSSVITEKIIASGADVIGTIGTADIETGVIKFICLWKPLSVDGEVTAA